MRIRNYIVFVFLVILIVGLYLYKFDLGNYLHIFPFTNFSLDLSVTMWIVVILLGFVALHLIFFSIEWIRAISRNHKKNTEYNALIEEIITKVDSKNPKNQNTYSTNKYGAISSILSRFDFVPILDSAPSGNAKLDKSFTAIVDIKNQKVVNLKGTLLNFEGKYYIENAKNKITQDEKYAVEILNSNDAPESLKIHASQSLQNAKTSLLDKIKLENLGKESARNLLKILNQNDKAFNTKQIVTIAKLSELTQDEYVALAKNTKGVLMPDVWLNLFEDMADSIEDVEMAYFYVLFELEMLDKAKERRKIHGKNEYLILEAYMDLKKMGKNYPLDLFFK